MGRIETLKRIVEKVDRRLRERTIPHASLTQLVFGQQHIYTQSFFAERFGQYHTVPLSDLPHYIFLRDHLDEPYSDHIYSQYLACSWAYYFGDEKNTETARRGKIDSYLALYGGIKSRQPLGEKAIEQPVVVCERPDGHLIIQDGNHRASIALKLGLDLRAVFISPAQFMAKVINVPTEFYGTKRLNRPYQSIFYGDKEIIQGRRRDTYERMQRIRPADLRQKRVVDLGCNFGMSSYIASELGAAEVVGVDANAKIISAAVRLNSFYCAPVSFKLHDLNEAFDDVEPADTVFCFSLLDHLKSKEGILATLNRVVGDVLYLEGHARTTQDDYAYLWDACKFSRVELVGYGSDGVHTSARTRPLFRCQR